MFIPSQSLVFPLIKTSGYRCQFVSATLSYYASNDRFREKRDRCILDCNSIFSLVKWKVNIIIIYT